MIFCLGISHKDAEQAGRWLAFASFLRKREHPDQPKLIVTATKMAEQIALYAIRSEGRDIVSDTHILKDEDETGYPKSASHLFLRSMEHCEQTHPGEPVMWLETDTLPMQLNWRKTIAEEYAACGKPFMGHIETGHGETHLAGCAVYPADWRTRAPRLTSVLTAPDIFWGKGLGQAFDTWASSETVPQSHPARSIQQIWRPTLPVTPKWLLENVRRDVALMHQVKDASGFRAVREMLRL